MLKISSIHRAVSIKRRLVTDRRTPYTQWAIKRWRCELHPPHLINVATLPYESLKTKNATSSFNVNYKIAVTRTKLHGQFHKMFWWITQMNIHVRACVQSVHHQHACTHDLRWSLTPLVNRSIDDVLVKVKTKLQRFRRSSMSWTFVS